MTYIAVVLKNGAKVPVPDAQRAEWVSERGADGPGVIQNHVRLVCYRGDTVLGRFNFEDVAGYVGIDGNATFA